MPLHELIGILIEARQRERTVKIVYRDLVGNVTRRFVDPARIDGLWFLGWCLHREEYRRFDLRRIIWMDFGPGPNEIHLPLGDPEVVR